MPRALEQVQKTIRLHPAQAHFRRSTALYRAMVGGRGSGKSWVGAYDLIRRARKGRLYMVGAPTYGQLSDSTLRSFLAAGRELGVIRPDDVRKTPPSVTLSTGAEILFRSADDPERFRGPNLSGVWLDEASLMVRDAYDIAIACLREQGEQGWLSATFTPKGLTHWTYEVFATGRPNTELFRAKTADNPFNPPDFAETLRQQNPGRTSLQELDGEFIGADGVEWPADFFGPHLMFEDWPQDLDTKVIALDPSKGRSDRSGDYSAFVMLGVDARLNLWADCDMDNARPIEPLDSCPGMRSVVTDGLELFKAFRPQAVVFEANGFQEYVGHALLRHAAQRNIQLPVYAYVNTHNKQARIRTLGQYLAQRRLRIRNTPGGRMLVQQLRDFPTAAHDDGPDAAVLAVTMASYLIDGRRENVKAPELLRA